MKTILIPCLLIGACSLFCQPETLAAQSNAPITDSRTLEVRLKALSQLESGDRDDAGPDLGRYQVSRAVWSQATRLPFKSAMNPFTCANVVNKIMDERVSHFVSVKKRQPTNCEWYCLYRYPAHVMKMKASNIEVGNRFNNLCEKYK